MACSVTSNMRPAGGGFDIASENPLQYQDENGQPCTICIRCLFFWIGIVAVVLLILRNK